MTIEELPPYLYHDIVFDSGIVATFRFYLTINRDITGRWSVGYVKYADDDYDEYAIPQLVTNSSDTLTEAAARMSAKLFRYNKHTV